MSLEQGPLWILPRILYNYYTEVECDTQPKIPLEGDAKKTRWARDQHLKSDCQLQKMVEDEAF